MQISETTAFGSLTRLQHFKSTPRLKLHQPVAALLRRRTRYLKQRLCITFRPGILLLAGCATLSYLHIHDFKVLRAIDCLLHRRDDNPDKRVRWLLHSSSCFTFWLPTVPSLD